MTRSSRWVLLCSAVVALSALFASRSTEAPLVGKPAGAHHVPSAVLKVDADSKVARTANSGVQADATQTATAPASKVSAPATSHQAEEGKSYPGARVDRKVLLALHGTDRLTQKHPHMASAIEVKNRHTDQLLAHPAVVGTAAGINDDGQVAIIIMTKGPADDLPRIIENTPVVLWNTGEIFAQNKVAQEVETAIDKSKERGGKPQGGSTTKLLTQERHRPVPVGVSTGLTVADTSPYATAGTMGCRVRDGLGNVYALSNNHVYAHEGTAAGNAPVVQPGTLDSKNYNTNPETNADVFGNLSSFSAIVFSRRASNVIDAAIALSDISKLGNGTPLKTDGSLYVPEYDMPLSAPAVDVASNDEVMKIGRTTGFTTGKVAGLDASVIVRYDAGQARFDHQVYISGSGFSAGGDSGSLIVIRGSKAPLALLFAGGSSSTFGNPIGAVLTYFSDQLGSTVTVDGQ
jgi:hypothetical protein